MEALNDPQQRKDYFAKSLNVFTDAIDTYFDMMQVTSSDEKYNWTLEELAKLPIKWYGGADLSKMHDLTGATIYGTYKDVDITISHASYHGRSLIKKRTTTTYRYSGGRNRGGSRCAMAQW